MKLQIDINSDLGESYGAFKIGNDKKIMPHITSANVACGFHGGDPVTMMQTVALAKKFKVAIGAHAGYPDLMGFGRREMQLTAEEIESIMVYQIGALSGFAKTAGIKLQHVKPHGALYNKAAKDKEASEGIVKAIEVYDPSLIVFAPPKSTLAKVAADFGLRIAYEIFADRAYNSDGSLVSRQKPNAIIHQPSLVVKRAIKMIKEKAVIAVDGTIADFGEVHTICVHGDTPTAVKLAETLKKGLTSAGILVKPVSNII